MRLGSARWLVLGVACLLPGACETEDRDRPADSGVDLPAVEASAAQPDGPRPILLPDDEAPHSDPMEWWYYTGRLEAGPGEVYGFELTVFQTIFNDKPLYVGHFTVTDVQGGEFHSNMEVGAEDLRGAASTGFALEVGQLRMSGHDGLHRLSARMDRVALELTLTARKPPVLQYGTGWMTVGSDSPFYYYSYTRMDAVGSVTVDGERRRVTGDAWTDHQWGTIGTGYGWDWFSLRLDDDTEVMLFEVRRDDKPGFVGGTVIDAAGLAQKLGGGEFETIATGRWHSPHTGITYASGWRVEVPSQQLSVWLTPVMLDQEFGLSLLGSPIYWEGLCDVQGTRAGQPVTGHAYVEITGHQVGQSPAP